MSKRSRVISASALLVLGGFLLTTSVIGGSDLKAGGISETGYDLGQYITWGGIALLVISALLFVSSSAE